jgi:ribosome-associated protein
LIRTTTGAATRRSSTAKAKAAQPASAHLLADVVNWLDEAKAEEIVTIPLEGKSSLGDYMVVASGRTDRHVGAIADQIAEKVKAATGTPVRVEGVPACDWVLIDTGDIIIHVFRPEVREFYNLEKMWKAEIPPEAGQTDPSQH